MIKSVFLAAVALALPVLAGQKGEGKVDSMVYDQPTEWRIYSAGGPVKAFTLQKERVWYATDAGVASQGLKKGDVESFAKLGSFPSTDATCMATDASGKVWIGTTDGLALRTEKEFTDFTKGNGLPDDTVNALAAAGDGSLWVGTANGAALYQSRSWKTYGVQDGLLSNKIQAIVLDTRGAVWFGTDKGISVYDAAGKWTSYTMKKGMSWNDTKALGVDPRSNTIWAAVGEKDVNSFDGTKWNVYMQIQPGIQAIMVDSQSRIWFGSGTGLVKFNGDDWITDPKQIPVPAAQVSQMYRDQGGNLWFGMESGVLRFANPYPF